MLLCRAIECTACRIGSYQPLARQSSCVTCPVGKSQSQTGMPACVDCGAGYYNDQLGVGECSTCRAGSYTNTTGQTACVLCRSGTQSNSSQAAPNSCVDCAEGRFALAEGTAECFACPRTCFLLCAVVVALLSCCRLLRLSLKSRSCSRLSRS